MEEVVFWKKKKFIYLKYKFDAKFVYRTWNLTAQPIIWLNNVYSSKKRRCSELGTSTSIETLGTSVDTFEETCAFEGMRHNGCGKDIECKKGCYFSSQRRAKAKC